MIDQLTNDSLTSLVSGLGGDRDKFAGMSHYFAELDKEQIDAAYKGNWLAKKGLDIPAQDMTREWRAWQAENDQIEKIEKEEIRLGLQDKVRKAKALARRYGGAAMLLGVGRDDPSRELRPESVKQGSLKYVHVMSRYEIGFQNIRKNPEDPYYGQPEYYQLWADTGVLRGTFKIHPSRVILFKGDDNPDAEALGTIWGRSSLESANDAVKGATLAHQAISVLLTEAGVDVIRIPELMKLLSTEEGTARVTARLQRAATLKGLVNALLLDGGGGKDGENSEDYEKKQVNFSQLPETLQAQLMVASAAWDIPATRFLSQSPSGLNSTGDSDLKNYYDRIGAEQKNDLSQTLAPLDEILIRSATGDRDESIFYNWRPLFQKDAKELAEIEETLAKAIKTIMDTGLVSDVVMSKAVVNGMIEREQFPGLEQAVEEFGEQTEGFESEPDEDLPEDPEDDEA